MKDLNTNEEVVLQIKTAPNAGAYLFLNAAVNTLTILFYVMVLLICASIPVWLKKKESFNELLFFRIHLSDFNFHSLYLNSSFDEFIALVITVFLVIFCGLFILLLPMFFLSKSLRKRKIFFTNLRCFLNSPDTLIQIDYSQVECVTLSQTWLEKWLHIASIFILDKNALVIASNDRPVKFPGTLFNKSTYNKIPNHSLKFSALSERDAKNILEFFQTKNIKTNTVHQKFMDQQLLNNLINTVSNRKK